MTSGMGLAPPPIPQWDMAMDRDSAETLHRHTNGAGGIRPGRASECGLLAQSELAGDPAAVETQVSRDSHKATKGKEYQDDR